MVYLTVDVGNFTKGFHYWNGTAWTSISLPPSVTFKASSSPLPTTPKKGDESYSTSNGTKTGEISKRHIYDSTNWSWCKRPISI